MLASWKDLGKGLGKELSRAWENLTDGWRELLSRSGNALTHFVRGEKRAGAEESRESDGAVVPVGSASWSLLAGEVMETDKSLVVRLEVPGIEKQDCELSIEGNTLYVRGEKRFDQEYIAESYHILERAYGAFQRAIPLPRNVDPDGAEAAFKNGILTVVLPKTGSDRARNIKVK